MWYVGQKIVYITGINLPKNSIHVIRSLTHMRCGCISIDIGLVKNAYYDYLQCDQCKSLTYVNTNIRHFSAASFRPLLDDSIEYAENLLEEIETEINEENLIEVC